MYVKKLTSEYLYDEELIDFVLIYSIYEILD